MIPYAVAESVQRMMMASALISFCVSIEGCAWVFYLQGSIGSGLNFESMVGRDSMLLLGSADLTGLVIERVVSDYLVLDLLAYAEE